MNSQHKRPLSREKARPSSTISDDASCASSQSSVQRRVAELRDSKGRYNRTIFQETRLTSTTFPKQFNLSKKKKLFQCWKHLWTARSFYRYTLVRRSFRLLKLNCDLQPASTGDLSDVSDLSSVSTSLTSVSGRKADLHFNPEIPSSRTRGRHHLSSSATHEISRTIQELSLLYKTRNGHEDDETMTSLSTLNTVDFIHMASRPPQHQHPHPPSSALETDESDSGTMQFASSVLSSTLLESSPASSSTPNWRKSSGIGALLVQHGNILPTQSTPVRSADTRITINSFSPSKTPPFSSQGRSLSRSHGGSPIGHRRNPPLDQRFTPAAVGTTTPPPPPPPPLFSHNLRSYGIPLSLPLFDDSFDADGPHDPLATAARCRCLLHRWVLSHRRTVGIHLMAQDHYLKRGFSLLVRSLRRRVRLVRRLITLEQYFQNTALHRSLRKLFLSATRPRSRMAEETIALVILKQRFWRFVSRSEEFKEAQGLARNRSHMAWELFAERGLIKAMKLWRELVHRQNFERRARAKTFSLIRPHLRFWRAATESRRIERNAGATPREAIQRRSLRKWSSQYHRLLLRLQACTEMEIRREHSCMVLSLEALRSSSTQRQLQRRLQTVAQDFFRTRRLSKSFSRLVPTQRPSLPLRNGSKRLHLPFRSKRRPETPPLSLAPRLSASRRLAALFPCSRTLRRWSQWCQMRIRQRVAELTGDQGCRRGQQRRVFWRLSALLSRQSSRRLANHKLSRSKPKSLAKSLPRSSSGGQPSPSKSLRTNRPTDSTFRHRSARPARDPDLWADDWVHQRLLSSGREFFNKLRTLVSSRHQRMRADRQSGRGHQNSQPTRSAPPVRLSQSSVTASASSLRESDQIHSKETFLRERQSRGLLVETFLSWLTLSRVVQHHRHRVRRQGFVTYLRYCTRHTVSTQLLEFGEKYHSLHQKRTSFRIWRGFVDERDSQRRQTRGQATVTTTTRPVDNYLLERVPFPTTAHTRPPMHPTLSLAAQWAQTQSSQLPRKESVRSRRREGL
jgi:hypothetical protein